MWWRTTNHWCARSALPGVVRWSRSSSGSSKGSSGKWDIDVNRVTLALVLAAALAWQDPQRPPTFRTGAELVRVDVTVIDHKGLPVANLTADDFAVEEDGAP